MIIESSSSSNDIKQRRSSSNALSRFRKSRGWTPLGVVAVTTAALVLNTLGWVDTHENQQATHEGNNDGPKNSDYSLAARESFGFFDNIPEDDWLRRKASSKARIHHQFPTKARRLVNGRMKRPSRWYQTNWDPTFSCPFLEPVGGIRDGHKWVCDPHRLAKKKDCLVYSIGSNDHFDFEDGLQQYAPNCEIHIFDPADYSESITRTKRNEMKMTYHAWGLKGSYKVNETDVPANDRFSTKFANREGDYKTIQETAKLLGHEGRVVDLFKIDCEGCEWRSYKDWLFSGVLDLRQVLVEVHNVPPVAIDFFQDFHDEGYAIFSKEPNLGGASSGDCVEYSFLKLEKSFLEE